MTDSKFVVWRNRCFFVLVPAALFLMLALKLMLPIHLITADIGRHIKNGELILGGQTDVLYRNFYSYTTPEYPFINHHWLFGVMAYVVCKAIGFTGLALVYIGIVLVALLLFTRAALLRGHYALVMLFVCLALPLIAQRAEIRPEGLSALFTGLYFYLLTKLSFGQIRRTVVFPVLIVIQIIWVNTHIFFFMGPILVAIFLWEGASRGCKICARNLCPLLLLSAFVNLINPSGLAGALTPLNTFREFGYRLAENQDVFFMMGYFPKQKIYGYYLFVVAVVSLGMVLAVRARGLKVVAPFIFLTAFMALAGVKAVRLMSPFAFFLVPLGTFLFAQAVGQLKHESQKILKIVVMMVVIGICGFYAFSLKGQGIGLGLVPGVNASAEFFKRAGISGPVFSNYDIGGYLIYHLAPKEQVFVDNRQEAFPPEFFKDTYMPMQEDVSVWTKKDKEYGFNAIYFYRHDLTPWGQNFLIARVRDPDWAPVFVDAQTIIFLKRNSQNMDVIKSAEYPQAMFGVRQ